MEFVVLVKSFPTSIWLQKSASIQPRTSPSKFGSQITLSITYRASCTLKSNVLFQLVFTSFNSFYRSSRVPRKGQSRCSTDFGLDTGVPQEKLCSPSSHARPRLKPAGIFAGGPAMQPFEHGNAAAPRSGAFGAKSSAEGQNAIPQQGSRA